MENPFQYQPKPKLWKLQILAPQNQLKSLRLYQKVRKSSQIGGFWFLWYTLFNIPKILSKVKYFFCTNIYNIFSAIFYLTSIKSLGKLGNLSPKLLRVERITFGDNRFPEIHMNFDDFLAKQWKNSTDLRKKKNIYVWLSNGFKITS